MTDYRRYALYAMVEDPLHSEASRWLGWDSRLGRLVYRSGWEEKFEDVATITAAPHKYGFHGTLKPPFRLAPGQSEQALREACVQILPGLNAAVIPQMTISSMRGFVALVPSAPEPTLNALCDQVVQAFEPFRAPLNDAELAKRRAAQLTSRQEELLVQWGYPYVMDEFHFHMTLSGKLDDQASHDLADGLSTHFGPFIPQPFILKTIGLMGEDADGMFHEIEAYTLAT